MGRARNRGCGTGRTRCARRTDRMGRARTEAAEPGGPDAPGGPIGWGELGPRPRDRANRCARRTDRMGRARTEAAGPGGPMRQANRACMAARPARTRPAAGAEARDRADRCARRRRTLAYAAEPGGPMRQANRACMGRGPPGPVRRQGPRRGTGRTDAPGGGAARPRSAAQDRLVGWRRRLMARAAARTTCRVQIAEVGGR
jgi:hypothetical protein